MDCGTWVRGLGQSLICSSGRMMLGEWCCTLGLLPVWVDGCFVLMAFGAGAAVADGATVGEGETTVSFSGPGFSETYSGLI